MMTPDQVSYMMLFCALVLVKKNRARLEESLGIVPLTGQARELSGERTQSRCPV